MWYQGGEQISGARRLPSTPTSSDPLSGPNWLREPHCCAAGTQRRERYRHSQRAELVQLHRSNCWRCSLTSCKLVLCSCSCAADLLQEHVAACWRLQPAKSWTAAQHSSVRRAPHQPRRQTTRALSAWCTGVAGGAVALAAIALVAALLVRRKRRRSGHTSMPPQPLEVPFSFARTDSDNSGSRVRLHAARLLALASDPLLKHQCNSPAQYSAHQHAPAAPASALQLRARCHVTLALLSTAARAGSRPGPPQVGLHKPRCWPAALSAGRTGQLECAWLSHGPATAWRQPPEACARTGVHLLHRA